MKLNKVLQSAAVAITLLATLACSLDEQPSATGSQDVLQGFNDDSMTQPYSGEWVSESGGMTFVLKDNSYFLLQDGTPTSIGVVTRRMPGPSVRATDGEVELITETIEIETSMVFASEVTFQQVGGTVDLSTFASVATLLPGFNPPALPDVPRNLEWITQSQFESWSKQVQQSYFEYQIDYIESYYATQLGIPISS